LSRTETIIASSLDQLRDLHEGNLDGAPFRIALSFSLSLATQL
jgi:hypothetical protein